MVADSASVHFLNPAVERTRAPSANDDRALRFHQRTPGYRPSPLVRLPELARALGVRGLWLKDETSRFGLPAFKALGAWWAGYCALCQRLGTEPSGWRSFADLRERFAALQPLTLAAATDGNHGRAVARFARLVGLDARIVVPAGVEPARIVAIEREGAQVDVLDGTYEQAIETVAAMESAECVVLADVSWPGYEQVPRWIAEGYETVLLEVQEQFQDMDIGQPDVVFVPIGVGTLAAGVAIHYSRLPVTKRAILVGVEPLTAACALESVRAGRVVDVPGCHDSMLTTLNAARPSELAFPLIRGSYHGFVAIGDDWVRKAMRLLADCGIVAGPAGAAGLAALLDLHETGDRLARLVLDGDATVLLLCTEGLVDPQGYRAIVGREAAAVWGASRVDSDSREGRDDG